MVFTRSLRKGDYGEDVRSIKNALFSLGQYAKHITKISNSYFRADTEKAVKAYQRSHVDMDMRPLEVDGIVGPLTWAAIERDGNNKVLPEPPVTGRISPADFPNLAQSTIDALNTSWQGISEARVDFMLYALKWAYDPAAGGEIHGLYNYGANLYNFDKASGKQKLCIYSPAKIKSLAAGSPKYYNGGRLEMMLAAKEVNPDIPSTDCSGQEIGIMRLIGYIKSTGDATANGLCGSSWSKSITRDALQPGDFVGYDGHIGLYIGAGRVCEAAGGAYGVQITRVDDRRMWDFVDHETVRGKVWTKFRRPKFY